MEWNYPNESEKLKIKKMKQSFHKSIIISIILVFLVYVLLYLPDKLSPYNIVLAIILLLVAIAIEATRIIRLKCPRCSARATIPKGSCGECGLKFD